MDDYVAVALFSFTVLGIAGVGVAQLVYAVLARKVLPVLFGLGTFYCAYAGGQWLYKKVAVNSGLKKCVKVHKETKCSKTLSEK